MTHTSGPWRMEIRGTVPLIFKKDEGSRMPLAVVKERYMSYDERLANARLIAAAPALLEALEKAAVVIADLMLERPTDILLGIQAEVEGAIEDAKGESE